MKKNLFIAIILISVVTLYADTMIVGSKSYTGTLEGFKNNNFIFKINYKKTLKKPRTNVKKLTTTTPYNVTYIKKGITHNVKLIKYENSKFFFKTKDGNETTVYGGAIKNLTIEQHPMFAHNGNITNTKSLKTKLNLKELAASDNLSMSQKIAIKNYIAARKAYIQFQKESSIMVKERDQANGKKREELMNKLQLRKNAEQPLKNKLQKNIIILNQEFAENID